MFRGFILCLLTLIFSADTAISGDLVKILIRNDGDAENLNLGNIKPLVRINDGYLAVFDDENIRLLSDLNIQYELIAKTIVRENIAIDHAMARTEQPYRLLYQEGSLRLYYLDREQWKALPPTSSLSPVAELESGFKYFVPMIFDTSAVRTVQGMQEMINLVRQDSLESYVSRLQAFRTRVAGTDSNRAASQWIAAQFESFGYDSVMVDSFVRTINQAQVQCRNIIATKVGSALPGVHLIVGAHYDAEPYSPGADDNGSGMAGVLELARILADLETEVTIRFILFDGEEYGLLGSSQYVQQAVSRGDDIIYMHNMDMIGYYENTDQAILFHGADTSYSQLWQYLADSLVGIDGIISGSHPGSDHFPFEQNGYPVTFVFENILSTVFHTFRDSTSYMNFNYLTRLVKGSLATVYAAAKTYLDDPLLTYEFPGGMPMALVPDQPTSFEFITVGLNGAIPVPGTAQLHYRIDSGAWQTEPVTELLPGRYVATLPSIACGGAIEYYLSVEEAVTGVVYCPDPGQPQSAFPATEKDTIFFDDFESDLGWIISSGMWERGSPTGGGGECGSPDPVGGYNSPTAYGYNLNGDYTSNMPKHHLSSPAIDCSDRFETRLTFRRWLGVEHECWDDAYVMASTDGMLWSTIWSNDAEVKDGNWVLVTYDISYKADNQPVVYLRFTMGPTNDIRNYCGWNIDNVEVTGYICESIAQPLSINSITVTDWTVGCPFAQQLLAAGGVAPYSWTDKFGTLAATGLTLGSTGLISGTPSDTGPVTFTARVEDDNGQSSEREYSFEIHPPVVIEPDIIPDAAIGRIYAHSLSCAGGSGNLLWSDRDDDLAGTGLSLSARGVLSGIPSALGPVSFTARVTEMAGSSDEMAFELQIRAFTLCGDANGDEVVNVGDVVFLINHIFKNGPPPEPDGVGDANCDGGLNVGDAVYLINYIFGGGPAPCCS